MNASNMFSIFWLAFLFCMNCEAALNRTVKKITYATEASCPKTYTFYKGHCYMVSNFTCNWFTAKSYCEQNSGMLFIVRNDSDREIFTKELNASVYKSIWV